MSKMPQPNEALRAFFQNNDIFADLFNTFLFGGEQVILPGELQPEDSALEDTVLYYQEGQDKKQVQTIRRYRDIARRAVLGTTFVILGIENQDHIHYAMPVRNMLYDALGYIEEMKRMRQQEENGSTISPKSGGNEAVITKGTEEPPWTADEYLSRFRKGERITPIYTLVFYTGKMKWDGPRCLHDMLPEMPEKMKSLIPDYPLNILDIGHDEGYNFTTEELKQLDSVMKIIYSEDRDNPFSASNRMISLGGILSHIESLYLAKDREGEQHMNETWSSMLQKEVEQAVAVTRRENEEQLAKKDTEIAKKDAEIAELRSRLIRAGLMAP